MPVVVTRPAAKRDLILYFAAIAEGSLESAQRFRHAAEKSFQDLARMPRWRPGESWREGSLARECGG
jgi:plasmid stabilization system protein ParE